MQVWELTFASVDRADLAGDEATRRACVRALARASARNDVCGLVAFCLRADRLRLLVVGEAAMVGYLRGALFRSLKAIVDAPLVRPDVREMGHRAHILSLLRHYVAPVDRDCFEVPAALSSGSCFGDLLGARRVRGMRLATGRVLPRLRGRDLLSWVGLPAAPVATHHEVRRLGASRVAAAASFSTCVSTTLGGSTADAVTARRLPARICTDAGIPSREIAHATGVTTRAARRLAVGAPDADLEHAVRLRLAIEQAVGRDALLAHASPRS